LLLRGQCDGDWKTGFDVYMNVATLWAGVEYMATMKVCGVEADGFIIGRNPVENSLLSGSGARENQDKNECEREYGFHGKNSI
jgi:hypothetical protein